MTNPISSKERTMSRLAFSPESSGPMSKNPPFSLEFVVGCPSSSVSNKKNSFSGPTLKVYPSFSACSSTFFKIRLGSASYGVPSGFSTSQINRATRPLCGRHGKMVNVSRSGARINSDKSLVSYP